MRKLYKSMLIASLSILLGCNGQPDNAADLKVEIEEIKKELKELKEKVELREFLDELETKAYLKPGDQGYSTISYDLGVLTVRINNVQPYANGVRATLSIGNPLSATVRGLTANVDYGKLSEKGYPLAEFSSKQIKFNEELKPGSWTNSSVVLEGVDFASFGYIRINSIKHVGIRLYN